MTEPSSPPKVDQRISHAAAELMQECCEKIIAVGKREDMKLLDLSIILAGIVGGVIVQTAEADQRDSMVAFTVKEAAEAVDHFAALAHSLN